MLSALTAALLWLAPARSGRAAVYTYNTRQRTINAGVVFVGSAADPATRTGNGSFVPDPAPYLFRVLDLRPDVKPVGWSFVNPLAPANVTTAISTRWNINTGAYVLGAAVTPDMAAYWEVPLRDVSADDLQQYDVLYLTGSTLANGAANAVPILLNPTDNEKLRRFVDNGGQLIVEYGVNTSSSFSPFSYGNLPLFDSAVWAQGSSTTSSLIVPGVGAGFDLHPIIIQPNFFSPGDLLTLGAPDADNNFGSISQPGANNIFGTVLLQGNGDGVEAAQLGAGEIVTSALNIGPTVSIWQGPVFGVGQYFGQAPYVVSGLSSYLPPVVPASDLKLLSNILSWADTHPTENKTSHQNAAGPSSASFSAAWSKLVNGSTAPPGAAVWGNYVYVTDAAGILHAFDAIPDESLTNTATADDGIPDFISATPTPYDEVWNARVGGNASAPTVASFGGTTYVFVEKADGSVVQYASVTGALVKTLTQPSTNPTPPKYPQGGIINAPTPTVYDGRVYAGQGDGSLFVYSVKLAATDSAAGGVVIPVDPTKVDIEYATAAPAVGLLGAGTITNNIIALVPTSQNMNTVLLGGRNDPLTAFSGNGQFAGYNVNRTTRYRLFNLFVDLASFPAGQAYDGNGNNQIAVSGGQDPVFGSTNQFAGGDDFYGDWDSDFRASTGQSGGSPSNGSTLTLHEIKALSLANTIGGAIVSAPAIDRHGDYYYVVNAGADSYLFGVHDDVQQRNVLVKFRFRLPRSGDSSAQNANGSAWNNIDADNVNYNNINTNPSDGSSQNLMDFHFVGTPVVDGQGNVYVAAQKIGGPAAVLCFNADKVITADPVGASGFLDDATASFFQLDEFDGTTRNPIAQRPVGQQNAGRVGQMTTTSIVVPPGATAATRSGQAVVFSFSRGSGGARQIAGNLTEPQPFTATPGPPSTVVSNQANQPVTMLFHTNLAWYATFATNGTISGLSKAGNTLMLCDSGAGSSSYNTLYKLSATPIIGAGKVAALTVLKSPLGTDINGKPLSIGAVTAAPSAGGGAMVINGSGGIAAFNQQLTLIADSNRILEVDADGKAVWSADATTRLQSGTGLTTKVDFAHPSALAQFAPNDYLVADTGNNRCVRFDRGGGVLWELTRFYDPSGLMAPGQSSTLSAPTSVEVRREDGPGYTDPYTTKSATSQFVHYLVADSGNDRIVEVTDTLDASGNVLAFDLSGNVVKSGTLNSVTHNHLLTWVTHTGDKYGRRYHYAGASYLNVPSTTVGNPSTLEIFALITNARIATPTPVLPATTPPSYTLAPASSDAPGGSIVAFNRPLVPKAFTALGASDNDINYVATSFTSGSGSSSLAYSVRNPRFLHVFAPPQAPPTTSTPYQYSFLYADDNGAFDLVYTGATTPPASYGLAFTQALYQSMVTPADFQGNVPPRGGAPANGGYPALPAISFVPTCVQRLNDDATNVLNTAHIERYLITQSYSQGELGTILRPSLPTSPVTPAILKAGGEIFEVDVSTPAGAGTIPTTVYPGGFGAAVTLSRPVGASPLTQPTYAIRTTQ